MCASIFHDLQQPLSSLNNYASGLMRMNDASQLKDVKPVLHNIQEQVLHANDMISRFSHFTQKKPIEKTYVCLQSLIKHALSLMTHVLMGIQLKMRFMPKPVYIYGDKLQFLQIIMNIIQNASDAMCQVPEDMRHLVIAVSVNDQAMAHITIHNTGESISKDALPLLFEPFYTTKKDGVGIGLALAQRIITMHDGMISVESTKATGTTFIINLPLSQPPPQSSEHTKTSNLSQPVCLP